MNRSTNPEELAQLLLQVEGAAAGAASGAGSPFNRR
jgi:hypothetical protein